MSKYYTPEIEEFHVGFECESLVTTAKGILNIKIDWHKVTIGGESKYDNLVKGELMHSGKLLLNLFRVKYLDREDIESLGYEFDRKTAFGFRFIKNTSYLFFRSFVEDNIMIMDLEPLENPPTYIIKNKSELIKLLKQKGL